MDEIEQYYDKMRQLNPDLPEWENASLELRERHQKTYDELIKPLIDKIKLSTQKVGDKTTKT